MIDTEKFLDLIQNHHHRGSISDGNGNFCYAGAVVISTSNKYDEMKLFKATFKFLPDKSSIAKWNDSESTSHEDIILVAKKAVAELDL